VSVVRVARQRFGIKAAGRRERERLGGDDGRFDAEFVKARWLCHFHDCAALSVVRDFETGGGLNQERVWRIMVDVTRLVCGVPQNEQ
jgi:hypothetical protein